MTALPTDRRRAARGFTLIELAIVLAIAATLLRVAAPGMARTVAARALAAQVSEFMAALRFARSEAMKRGVAVTLCAAAPQPQASACQVGRHADWRFGWVVFVDGGRRGTLEAGDTVLRVQQALQRSGGVAGTRAGISFTAAGYSTDASSHFLFSPPAEAAADAPPPVLVCVSKQGRPRLAGAGAGSCA
ncbi:MAG: GspH/FimT family pseudopilin [Betaproteobacteria bacterium]